MRLFKLFLMAALMLAVTAGEDSCDFSTTIGSFGSLHPVFSAADSSTYDPGLLGSWFNAETGDTLTIERRYGRFYLVSCTYGCEVPYSAHLTSLNSPHSWGVDHRRPRASRRPAVELDLLDMQPLTDGENGWPVVPLHWPFWIRHTEGKLELASALGTWLDDLLAKTPSALPHARVDAGLVITAPTKQLRRFLADHLAEQALDDTLVYIRLETKDADPESDQFQGR